MQTQAIPQPDADEIVRILLVEHTAAPERSLFELAVAEGMPLTQAIETVRKYTTGLRCFIHNAVRCTRC